MNLLVRMIAKTRFRMVEQGTWVQVSYYQAVKQGGTIFIQSTAGKKGQFEDHCGSSLARREMTHV